MRDTTLGSSPNTELLHTGEVMKDELLAPSARAESHEEELTVTASDALHILEPGIGDLQRACCSSLQLIC